MTKKINSGVLGINELDGNMLAKIVEKANETRPAVDKMNKKRWVSNAISKGFIEAFGMDEFKAMRKAWVEKFLDDVPEDF